MSRKIKDRALSAFIAGSITRDEYMDCVSGAMFIRGRSLYKVAASGYVGWYDFSYGRRKAYFRTRFQRRF